LEGPAPFRQMMLYKCNLHKSCALCMNHMLKS